MDNAIATSPRTHVVVGNINVDISIKVDRFPRPDENVFAKEAWIGPGGAASNYAVAVARLGHRPILVARAGEDALRLGIIDYLRLNGVDTSRIIIAKGENTGTVVVIVVPRDSTRTMLTVRGANEGLTGTIVPGEGDLAHFASVRGRILLEASGRLGEAIVAYDPGGEVYRDPEGVARAISLTRIVFLNELEAAQLFSSLGLSGPQGLLREGRAPEVVVVKLGRGGARAYTKRSVYHVEPCPARRVVDTTGAGDAFDAAFNYCMLQGCSIETALAYASAAGSAKVSRRGSSNMPSKDEIDELASRCYGITV